ncbi:MAG: DegT/DnrJ/EryC1/StrS family aminotransferase [Rhodospirillales bacterium]
MYLDLAVSSWDQAELDAINDVIASDMFTMGARVKEFETAFASYFGVKHGVMVNSGSSANLVAVAAFAYRKQGALKPGDEVLVPAIAWATTYSPLHQYGLKMRVVDVELDSLNMDVALLEAALTPKTKAIVGVSILGNPAKLDVMRAFADKHGLLFLEDNCESADAELNGQKTGTFGDIGTFSFFFSHHLMTIEGGMALTDDDELAQLMRCIRAHGWTRDLGEKSHLHEPLEDSFNEAYRFLLPGYNVRPTEISGAIGLRQLEKLPRFTETRRANLARFESLFGPDERFIIQKENGKSSSFCFPIILNPAMALDRNAAFEALKQADVGFRMITGGNVLRHDVAEIYGFENRDACPNADQAHYRGFFVGNHPKDIRDKLDTVYKVLDRALS